MIVGLADLTSIASHGWETRIMNLGRCCHRVTCLILSGWLSLAAQAQPDNRISAIQVPSDMEPVVKVWDAAIRKIVSSPCRW